MWPGELKRVRIVLSPPSEFLRPEACLTSIEPWVLPGFRREDVVQAMRDLLIPPEVQHAILDATDCTPGEGCVVRPPADAVFALEPMTRQALYRLLGDLFGNPTKRSPLRIQESELSRFAVRDGLSSSAQELLRRLTVNDHGWVLFWDSGALCQRMNDEDRSRFIRVVTHAESYLVKLVLRSDTDVEPIIRYWSGSPRRKSVRTLLENARPDGDATIRLDIVHLLPSWMRALAYTYPSPEDPPFDCHWTTLNFFEQTPDNRFLDHRVVQEEFRRRFKPIPRESARYGDVVAIMDPTGAASHTAIFLAEDLVFSKNGNSRFSPWVVTTVDSLIRLYYDTSGTQAQFFRRQEM